MDLELTKVIGFLIFTFTIISIFIMLYYGNNALNEYPFPYNQVNIGAYSFQNATAGIPSSINLGIITLPLTLVQYIAYPFIVLGISIYQLGVIISWVITIIGFTLMQIPIFFSAPISIFIIALIILSIIHSIKLFESGIE